MAGKFRRLVWIAVLVLMLPGVALAGPDISLAEKLVSQRRFEEAYALLKPFEFEMAGDLSYDYLLGVSALNAGHPDLASVILERVLAVDPAFAGARFDLARAYFLLGGDDRAKQELDIVAQSRPPPGMLALIRRYLGEIEDRRRPQRQVAGYVQFGLGHDTNVNTSTGQSQFAVPVLGNLVFTLDPNNVKRGDGYRSAGAGAELTLPAGDGLALFSGVDLRYRNVLHGDRFDYTSADARLGVAATAGAALVRAAVTGGHFALGGRNHRSQSGAFTEISWPANPDNQIDGFAQYDRYRYPDPALAANSFNQHILGGGLTHLLPGGAAVSAALFAGGETATDNRVDGDKRMFGFRLGVQMRVDSRIELFAWIGGQQGKFLKENPVFLRQRRDALSTLSAGLRWHLDARWTLAPQITRVRNGSNIDLNAFDRTDVLMLLRRDF